MKEKIFSVIEIFLLISAVFAFAAILNSDTVEAQIASECCEKTLSGAWCQNSENASCNSAFRSSPTSCDATSFCRSGCCYDSQEGLCMTSTPQRVCQDSNGTWSDNADCEIPQCDLGCCILENEAALVTLTRCKKLSAFYGLTTDFRNNIQDEVECIEIAQGQDRGACVYEADYIRTCSFTTRQNCNSGVVREGSLTGNITFHKDWLCTADELATDCGPSQETTCIDGKDEVYFVDTCGNPANIYDSSKYNDDDYWKKVVSKAGSCGGGALDGNADDASCGNCDYFYGSICRQYERGQDVRPSMGDFICRDLDCYDTYDGRDLQHGETWCIYDGNSIDDEDSNSVGARHIRHICVNGEEIIEPCADFRQEVCIEDFISTNQGNFLQAGCRANRWQDCILQNETDDCENTDKRDCSWLASKPEGTDVQCIPTYSPGLDFYADEGDAEGICSMANAKCIVTYKKEGFGSEDCDKNCECLDASWENQMKNLCKSMGDCDGKLNYVGEQPYDQGWEKEVNNLDFILPIAKFFSRGVVAMFGDLGVVSADALAAATTAVTEAEAALATARANLAALTQPAGGAAVPWYNNPVGGGLFQGGFSSLAVTSLLWGAGIGGLLYMGAGLFGASDDMAEALGIAGFAGGTSASLASYWIVGEGAKIGTITWAGLGVGIVVGVIVFALVYEEKTQKEVIFTCETWEAPVGGNDCELCNKDAFKPCSEYRCKSLGQACELLNAGSIGNESCAWVNPHDVTSPTIAPWEDVLTLDHRYTEVKTRPPGTGMKIVSDETSDGCIKAFTPVTFGLSLNEPAQCKIDYNHTASLEEMTYYFGETQLFLYNHSQTLRLPGMDAMEDAGAEYPYMENDGTFTLYARCRDANGNENHDEFAVRFCVESGPDLTPPVIERTSIINNMPIAYNTTEVYLEVYINEPSECKWSKEDKDYDVMENSFSCVKQLRDVNPDGTYTCSGTLTGIQDRIENDFYFRCKDQPGQPEAERNENRQSYEFMVRGTEALDILEAGPNETIEGGTDLVPVYLEMTTDNGCCNGDAQCYYSLTGKEDTWINFFETDNYMHRQRQDLPGGDYKYYFKCTDLGGNTAFEETEFEVVVDREAPKVVRAYQDTGPSTICGNVGCLKIVTDEDSTCSYSTTSCNFNLAEGIQMPYANTTEHFAEWSTDFGYYIKCEDESGSEPLPSWCSIVVRAYNKK
ncbi:MAG: hypothetical protein ABIE22_01715 [archaeon]